MKYLISFRSTLNICNYDCWYCPWAGTFEKKNLAKELEDAKKINRLVQRLISLSEQHFSLYFVPRAEFLILKHYQEAIGILSHQKNIETITIQTNLSFSLASFLQQIQPDKIKLWITYHPDQVDNKGYKKLLHKIKTLQKHGIKMSVGAVGLKENLAILAQFRQDLPSSIYFWVNAFKRESNYYSDSDLKKIAQLDPFFESHNIHYPSYQKECHSGETSFFLEESGQMRRCNFTQEEIGNFYESNWEEAFKPRRCPLKQCSCYQGLMHIPALGFDQIYGDLKPARIPLSFQ